MEDLLNGVDDDLATSMMGSPSDALLGLEPDTNPIDHDYGPAGETMAGLDGGAMLPEAAINGDYYPEDMTAMDTGATSEAITDDKLLPIEEDILGLGPTISSAADAAPDTAPVATPVAVGNSIEQDADQEIVRERLRPAVFEIVLPYMPLEEREKYVTIKSDVVDEVFEEVSGPEGELWYKMEFTDGRRDIVSTVFYLQISFTFSLSLSPNLFCVFLLLSSHGLRLPLWSLVLFKTIIPRSSTFLTRTTLPFQLPSRIGSLPSSSLDLSPIP